VMYRSEIDGLRALAVIPVILFHAGVPYIGGGFVGVDIFFVISGYLITLSLQADESFSPIDRVTRFYERRVKRIIPALVVVVVAALVAGVALLLPVDLMQLGKSAIATAFFTSNIWFWSRTLAHNGAFPQIRPSQLPESFHNVIGSSNVQVVNLSEALCLGGTCAPAKGHNALYGDGNHISVYAANTVITEFLKEKLPYFSAPFYSSVHQNELQNRNSIGELLVNP
jgi:acyltransferase-like protein/SGNH domain-containing protein